MVDEIKFKKRLEMLYMSADVFQMQNAANIYPPGPYWLFDTRTESRSDGDDHVDMVWV